MNTDYNSYSGKVTIPSTITYNGVTYTETNDFNEIEPSRTSEKNIFYIEVNKDILNAEKINLSFNIRNNTYKYILRGDISE